MMAHTHHQRRTRRHMAWSSVVHVMAALIAHIPCCGLPLILSMFGLQIISATFASAFYSYQFVVPLVVSAMVCGLLYLQRWVHHQTHHHELTHATIARIVAMNLLFGYIIVTTLYMAIPPQRDENFRIQVSGWVSPDQQTIVATYVDLSRSWPWSQRMFVSTPQSPPRELHWYAQHYIKRQWQYELWQPIMVHLEARPQLAWAAKNQSSWFTTTPTVSYFIRPMTQGKTP